MSRLAPARHTHDAPEELDEHLRELLGRLVSRKEVPHAIMAVESIDGSLRWVGAAGEATPEGTPMTAHTPFYIASVDKLLTATVILKLRERSELSLDEPISAYLPDTLIGGVHRLDGVDYTSAITVRHLLSHTSGLADWLEDRPTGGRSMIERIVEEGDMSLSLEELLDVVRSQLTPRFPPQPANAKRQKVRYCDTNYILLIGIIEAVTGQPLHEIHQELLFRPLNLVNTWVAGHSRPRGATPEPAALWAANESLGIPQIMRSIWGVYSTAEDTLRFLRGLVRGEVFDDPATLHSMQERWNRFGPPLDRAALRLPSWPIEYGLGIMRFHDPVLGVVGRLPPVLRPLYPAPPVIGHTGSTGSWLFHCPRLNLLLSGTVDQVMAGALPYRLVPRILETVARYGQQRR